MNPNRKISMFWAVSLWNRFLSEHTHAGSQWGLRLSQTGRIPVRRPVLIRAAQRCAAVWAPSLRIQTRRGQDLAVFVQRRDRCHRDRLTARHNWLRNDNKHSRSVIPANLLVFSQSQSFSWQHRTFNSISILLFFWFYFSHNVLALSLLTRT